MIRLNHELQSKMVRKAVLLAGINRDLEDIATRRAALAEAIRIDALGGVDAVKAIEDAMAEVAKVAEAAGLGRVRGWHVPVTPSSDVLLGVKLGGRLAPIPFNGWDDFPGKEPVYKALTPTSAAYDAEHQFTAEFRELERRTRKALRRREDVRGAVGDALRPFDTVGQLLKAWPAAAELLPDEDGEAKPQLPAVRTGDLNNLIGLPTKGAK